MESIVVALNGEMDLGDCGGLCSARQFEVAFHFWVMKIGGAAAGSWPICASEAS